MCRTPIAVRTQTRELFVAAPPGQVWRELVDTRDIAPGEVESAWMYRIGVPLPTAGAGDFRDGEHLRHITMGRGVRFDQVAIEWRENQRVSWRYRFDKDSFPPGALDDHVRIGGEYFGLGDTTYELRPEGDGTRLIVQVRYRVSTHFNWYAGPVADLLVGDFAENFLNFYGRRAGSGSGTGIAVTDCDDDQRPGSARQLHGHLVVERLAHECPGQRRIHADVAFRHVEFVRAHDAVNGLLAIGIFESHPGAEKYAPAIAGRLVDHGHSVEAFSQETHAPVDLAQATLPVGVFGIFGAITLRRRFGHCLGDTRTFHSPQLIELLFEARCACWSNELRTGFLCWSISTHGRGLTGQILSEGM